MSQDDVLFGFRLRVFTLAEELGSVTAACRVMGIDRSTYYRWKRKVDRWGLEALRIRERRRPRMPNQLGPHIEQRVIAFSLGHPGFGPRRIAAELAREKWGGLRISEHGVWRVLCRFGLNTRSRRGFDRPPPRPLREARDGHQNAHRPTEPGEKVQRDRFFVGRLSGTRDGPEYTAADVASGFAWAELHATQRNPRARWGPPRHRLSIRLARSPLPQPRRPRR